MKRQRGTTLIEALVALALVGVGLLSLVRGQGALRLEADVVRQRAEAVRLAEGELERLRSFRDAAGFRALRALPETEWSEGGPAAGPANTRFELMRVVDLHAQPPWLAAEVHVRWTDRRGQPASVALSSVVNGTEPARSGALAASSSSASPRLRGRSPAIPPLAADLGDGRSRWQPPGASIAWVFDNASGDVVGTCSLAEGALTRCVDTRGWLVSGEVRFATGESAGPAQAAHPDSPALDLDLAVTLTQGQEATCFDDADSRPAQTSVGYWCLVTARAREASWSGRLDVVPRGWLLGHDATALRVCRYSSDHDGQAGISNLAHPLDYDRVDSALGHQNFLVVRGDHACPRDTPPPPAGAFDASTVEQAPQPMPTPAG